MSPKRTGDPELDALWSMPFGELRKISEDESHPLHEKARQVAAEAAEPVKEALAAIMDQMNESVRPIAESLVRGFAATPGFSHPNIMEAIRQIRGPEESTRSESPFPVGRTVEWDDFDGAGDEITMAAVERVNEEHAVQLRQVGLLGELLDETRAAKAETRAANAETRAANAASAESLLISQKALNVARSSLKAGWWAAWGAIAAAVISAVGIWVTTFH